MATLEDRVSSVTLQINLIHDTVARVNWSTLNRTGFVLELSQSAKRLREVYGTFEEIERELIVLLEKGTPNLSEFMENFRKDMGIIDSNLNLEQSKRVRDEIVNETEKNEVPELYSSLQQRVLALTLRSRYNIDKVSTFVNAKKMPFVKKGSTARNLVDLLQKKDDELTAMKEKHFDLKRKNYFGAESEKSLADIEKDLHDMDKRLNTAVSETSSALKTHLAQITYVEGSFGQLKTRLNQIESIYDSYTKKTFELVKELKKERDYARTMALEIEQETFRTRAEYTKQLLELEGKKHDFEEKAGEKYFKQIRQLEKEAEEKRVAMKNLQKIIDDQEKEIKRLKSAAQK